MRLAALTVRDIGGLDRVEVSDLSDVVVFAGPNGVGKTRLIHALIQFFRDPRASSNIHLIVEPTSDIERTAWPGGRLDTSNGDDAQRLREVLQRSQRRNRYRSTVLNFESDRSIRQVKPFTFSWDFADPYEEDVGWDQSYSFLHDRFQDVQHSLFKLVESQRRKIAEQAVQLRAEGKETMPLDFADPLAKFKDAFSRLLAPKILVDINVKTQQILYELDGEKRPIETLSSGEREVVNIVFDFLLRNPSDCIVFFDEPELHLHPELSYKLLQTLSLTGKNNQFVFCTHSPEIITASIENSVVFVTPRKTDRSNQAAMVSRDDATHHALNLLGQSIGIISLGKKLLLIEGDEASLDKQTYGAILRNEFPELVLVPVGGKSAIRSFDEIRSSVLNQTIWGVEFFMLCDGDAVGEIGQKSINAHISDRLQVLPRYHLENYFLDENILAEVFTEMERDPASWLRSKDRIGDALREMARESIPYATALKVAGAVRESTGNVDVMPSQLGGSLATLLLAFGERISRERMRLENSLDVVAVESLCREVYAKIEQSIDDGSGQWKRDIPGRVVLNRFASRAQIQVGRLKTLYLRHAQAADPDPFIEIRTIFRSFRATTLIQPAGTRTQIV